LWMQRPILALVHRNPQMADLLRQHCHNVIFISSEGYESELVSSLRKHVFAWSNEGLEDNKFLSNLTTCAAVDKQLCLLKTAKNNHS